MEVLSREKSSFVALVLETVSGMLFAIGMCMALLPERNAFKPDVVLGSVGLALGLITVAMGKMMDVLGRGTKYANEHGCVASSYVMVEIIPEHITGKARK